MPMHIMQGSDPEFSIANSKAECVPADTCLSHSGMLGTDGRCETGELRPTAGSVDEHLASLRGLIGEFHRRFPDYIMLGGSRHFHQPLGGHIHFSGSGVRKVQKIVKALDVHLALPILMLENRRSAIERRIGQNYGFLGSWRDQRELHGGFEYRVLPSWIVSHQMAKMTLEIAMLIAYDYEKLYDKYNNLIIDTSSESFIYDFKNAKKEVLKPLALRAVEKLKTLPNAYHTMNSILTLENCIRLELRWRQEFDCCARWHLPVKDFKYSKIVWDISGLEPADAIIANEADVLCSNLVRYIIRALTIPRLKHRYYIYGILNRYGFDLSVSKPFDHYEADVSSYSISENYYGRARENAPSQDTILVGVSRSMRRNNEIEYTAMAIARIICELEGA
jgi:hypothetical protein